MDCNLDASKIGKTFVNMKERFILSETVDKEFVMETAIIRICRHIRYKYKIPRTLVIQFESIVFQNKD